MNQHRKVSGIYYSKGHDDQLCSDISTCDFSIYRVFHDVLRDYKHF